MKLLEKQQTFAFLFAKLITEAYRLGYLVTIGEIWRPPAIAMANAKKGTGIANSLHTLRLAADINLYKNGKWLTATADYKELGQYWARLSTTEYTCVWGGDFGDGNHFSIEHNGVK